MGWYSWHSEFYTCRQVHTKQGIPYVITGLVWVPMAAHETPMTSHGMSHGHWTSIAVPWVSHGLPYNVMGTDTRLTNMEWYWWHFDACHKVRMKRGIQWTPMGAHGLLWDVHGPPCDVHGNPWDVMGVPWGSHGNPQDAM